MRHWLGDWAQETDGGDAPNLWTAVVPAALWKRVGSSMRLKHASFFRIDHLATGAIPGGSYRVVSTVPTSHLTWEPISPNGAAELLCDVVAALPSDLSVRVWWSSRNWPLLPDRPDKEAEWTRLGRLRSRWADLKEVLDTYDIQLTRIRGEGKYWTWSGWQGKYRAADWPGLERDLGDGIAATRLARQIGLPPDACPGTDGCTQIGLDFT
jgi:hypothetical protein